MSATVRVSAATANDAANTSSHVPTADPPTTNDPSSCAHPVISAAVDPAAGTSTTDADNSPSNPPASILSKVESPASYCIRFEGNSSSQWDGKEIFVEKEWLESLYPRTSITKGHSTLSWEARKSEGMEGDSSELARKVSPFNKKKK